MVVTISMALEMEHVKEIAKSRAIERHIRIIVAGNRVPRTFFDRWDLPTQQVS
jgi:ATP:corrinoid adenosyltransferase